MIQTRKHIRNLYRMVPKARSGCLCLDMNEGMPGLPGKLVKKMLSKITPEYLAMYPEYQNIKREIAAHNGIKSENVCLASGSDGAIKYIFEAYISPGDKVLLTDPTFAMYPIYCEMFGARCTMIPYEKDFSFPMKIFCDAIKSGVKLAVVVNPNNPTGTGLTMEELKKIIRRAAQKKVLIIVDEAYFYFYPVTAMSLIKKYDNLIVLRTFSKLCGLASLRIGYASASPEVVTQLKKVRPTFDVNGMAVFIAEGLLKEEGAIEGLIDDMNEGAAYLVKKLSEADIQYRRGRANFILIKCPGRAGEIFNQLEGRKILIGGNFKQDFLKDYIRVTISNRANMQKFWNVFIKIWRRLS